MLIKRLFIVVISFMSIGGYASTTLVVVRHAQTTDNAEKIWSGTRRDPMLSKEGKEQVKTLTQALIQKYPHPDVILTAPYIRARETIKPYAEITGVTPIDNLTVLNLPSDSLSEAEHGSLTGLTFEQREGFDTQGLSQIELKAVASWKKFQQLSYEKQFSNPISDEPCVLSYQELSCRFIGTLKHIATLYPDKTVIIVLAGGGPLNALRERAYLQDRSRKEPEEVTGGQIFEIQGASNFLIVDGVKLDGY